MAHTHRIRTPRRTIVAVALVMAATLVPITAPSPATAQETLPPGGTFVDDDASVHEGAIEAISNAGVTAGCDPVGPRFCPAQPVTRGQMASFLVRILDVDASDADAFGDDDGTTHEAAINAISAAGITQGCRPGAYCPDQAVPRDQMASFLARAAGLDPIPPPPPAMPDSLRLVTVASGFDRPLLATAPIDDPRLFVVEQGGLVKIVAGGQTSSEPFLDLREAISTGGERGLLGLAFHPDYASNGRVFANYTDANGATVLAEYRVSSDPNRLDPASARTLLRTPQPFANHNGGHLAFTPDGLLVISSGDGGSGGDPQGNAQNPGTRLGALLRIDIDGGDPYAIPEGNPFASGAAPEVWHVGLRNPWRFSIDPVDELIYIADVGQGAREEIDVVPLAANGANFGWNRLEGTACYPPGTTCDPAGTVLPVLEYDHSQGQSVTGGHVYRGTAIRGLQGTYFYADFVSGFIRSFRLVDGVATDQRDWSDDLPSPGSISSFGTDGRGELYVVSFSGTVSQFVTE